MRLFIGPALSAMSRRILDGRVLPEAGKFEPDDEPFAFALTASRSTRRSRRSSNVSEATAGCCRRSLEGFGHADEAEGDGPVVCRM
jgi:hypothetical protein